MKRLSMLAALLVLTVAGPCLRPAAATEVAAMSLAETAARAESIVQGRVVSSRARWGDTSRRWMVTDYRLQVDEAIRPAQGVRTGTRLVLTFWGGTLDGETQRVAHLPLPQVGERYVLMLRPGWRTPGFTPLAGFNQGMFPIVRDGATGRWRVVDVEGRPLRLAADGSPVRQAELSGEAASLQASTQVTPEGFARWLRGNAERLRLAPSAPSPAPGREDPRRLRPFSKTPRLDGIRSLPTEPSHPWTEPASPSEPEPVPDPPVAPAGSPPAAGAGTRVRPSADTGTRWSTRGRCSLPVVVNQFPGGFAPWAPEDQFQMSKWNYYSDIFRVYQNPTGTFAWPDSAFDLCGWPDSGTMQRVYGFPWPDNVLGVCFSRYDGAGTIVESDIALNPAFAWTLDDEAVYQGSGLQSFRATMLHELGHMWGLQHQWDTLSIMNYAPAPYRGFPLPYMDDAEAIRAWYPSQAQARTDLAVYLYQSVGSQNWADATYPTVVTAGETFTVNDYHVENAGTATIEAPKLEWYLSRYRHLRDSFQYLGTSSYPALPRFTRFYTHTVGRTLTVPPGTPAGLYYLSAFVRGDEGAGQGSFPFSNNYAFSRRPILVLPRLESVRVEPTVVDAGGGAAGQVLLSGPAGPSGLTVSLVSSDPGAVTVPGQVFIGPSEQAASFSIGTSASSGGRAVTIAAAVGPQRVFATLQVRGQLAQLTRLQMSARRLAGGQTAEGRVFLDAPAPSGGLVVNLASNRPNAASVPASVVVPEGARDAAFLVSAARTRRRPRTIAVTITASAGAIVRRAVVTVRR